MAPSPREALDDSTTPARVRAVADEIPEKRVALRAALARVAQARLERFEIGMNVGQQRDQQRDAPLDGDGAIFDGSSIQRCLDQLGDVARDDLARLGQRLGPVRDHHARSRGKRSR